MKTFLLFIVLIVLRLNIVQAQTPALIWEQQREHSIGNLIARDSDNNIIVCGTYGNEAASDWSEILIIKFDTNGAELWSKKYSDTINGGINHPNDMAVDDFGNIYIAGSSHESFTGLPITQEVLLLKYDSAGNFLWKHEFGDSSNFQGFAYRLSVYKNKSIFLAGYGQRISGSNNKAFLAKYDSSGQQEWFFIDNNSYETKALDVNTDNIGNSYLSGATSCCTPGYKMFVSKFDSTGNILWNTVIFDSAHTYCTTHAACIDNSANIYVTGSTTDSLFSTGYDCAVAKIDSAGNQLWFYSYTSSNNADDREFSNDIIVDSLHNSYIAGSINKSQNDDAFVFKINTNGSFIWDRIYNGAGNDDDEFNSLCFTPEKKILLTGSGVTQPNLGGLCLFLYDSIGNEEWRVEKAGKYSGKNSVVINGSIYCTGFNSNVDLSFFDDSLFLFKFGDTLGLGVFSNIYELPQIKIYPNPFCDYLNISFPDDNNTNFSLSVFNMNGALVFKRHYTSSAVLST